MRAWRLSSRESRSDWCLSVRKTSAATTKRHPSQIVIKSWLDAENRILAHDVDVSLDGGAYSGLSSVVLQRTIFTVGGVYKVPNLRVRGRAYATNHPVSGAFRGFGGPQALFATEMQMERIARETGLDAMDLKRRHFLCQGDTSTTGGGIPSRDSSGEDRLGNGGHVRVFGQACTVWQSPCGVGDSGERR